MDSNDVKAELLHSRNTEQLLRQQCWTGKVADLSVDMPSTGELPKDGGFLPLVVLVICNSWCLEGLSMMTPCPAKNGGVRSLTLFRSTHWTWEFEVYNFDSVVYKIRPFRHREDPPMSVT
jgi:hypothetical protein